MTMNQKGRMERIAVPLEAIYPSPEIVGSELSLDELRAASRGWLRKTWESEVLTNQESKESARETEEHFGEAKSIVRKMQKLVVRSRSLGIPLDEVKPAVHKMEKLMIARDSVTVPLDENGIPIKDNNREGRSRRMKVKEVNETQISELIPIS